MGGEHPTDPATQIYHTQAALHVDRSGYGLLCIIFFILGTVFNGALCWLKRGKVRTAVDALIILIAISTWITVLLDLFLGLWYLGHEAALHLSPGWLQVWGFARDTNTAWQAGLMFILPLANILGKGKGFMVRLSLAIFVLQGGLLLLPFAVGGRFAMTAYYAHPILVHDNQVSLAMLLTWHILTQFIPILYFSTATWALLLVNVMRYSEMRRGLRPAGTAPETLMVINYTTIYALSGIPVLMELFAIYFYGFDPDCDVAATLVMFSHESRVLLTTGRAAVIPLTYLATRYGVRVVTGPVGKLVQQLGLGPGNYRRFRDVDIEQVSLQEVREQSEGESEDMS